MSIFGNLIKKRIENDKYLVEKNERILGNTIQKNTQKFWDEKSSLPEDLQEVEKIAKYFSLESPDLPEKGTLDAAINTFLSAYGVGKRHISLSGNWWKDGDGVILARFKEGSKVVALFPSALGGFYYMDSESGSKVRVNRKNYEEFEEEALVFYRPIPQNMKSGRDFFLFVMKQVRPFDMVLYFLSSIFRALMVTIPVIMIQLAFSAIIPTKEVWLLVSLLIMMIATSFGNYLICVSRYYLNLRIQNRLDTIVQNAVYSKVLSLPHEFFSEKTAGGLSQSIAALNKLPKMVGDILFIITNILIAVVESLPIMFIAPRFILPVTVCILLELLLIVISFHQERKLVWKQLVTEEENGAVVYDMISGIERIRVSGSEDRAYAKWLRIYQKQAASAFAARFPLYARRELSKIIQLAGVFWGFYIAFTTDISIAQLAVFTSTFGSAFTRFDPVFMRGQALSMIGPTVKIGEPILLAEPENAIGKKVLNELSGEIELSHVSFSYSENSTNVLDNLSLKIHPGEYVAIVGKSGCGKSTLVRLLLGFEHPKRGSISYDGNEISQVDTKSLRKNIGTVLQDGKLFAGDIYSNIAVTAPGLSMDEAWDVAEKVGMAEDIRNMPMGMNTVLSEGSGGISGGQKQRLMIARAIANKPGVIIMDEATSALDNLTQKIVTESMDAMNCTRIVIAHRLSTIRQCDRIIAMDKGHIVESGSYDELIEKGGFFADLVARQQINSGIAGEA